MEERGSRVRVIMRIEVRRICPALKGLDSGPVIEFDSARQTSGGEPCVTGGGYPNALILGDRYLNRVGNVEVACDGCSLLKEGFRVTVKKKIA